MGFVTPCGLDVFTMKYLFTEPAWTIHGTIYTLELFQVTKNKQNSVFDIDTQRKGDSVTTL